MVDAPEGDLSRLTLSIKQDKGEARKMVAGYSPSN